VAPEARDCGGDLSALAAADHEAEAAVTEMTREDYHRVAEIVDGLSFADPESHEQRVWNMALKLAAGQIRREAVNVNAPWAETTTTGRTTEMPKGMGRQRAKR
jgi:hypothetical protein